MLKPREEKVAIIMANYISIKHDCKCKLIQYNEDNYLYIYNKKIDLLITVCDTNKKKCIKIEEILINEKYRNKGLGTELINIMKDVAYKENVTIGLWCELNNDKLFNFYSKLGFKYIETLNDNWLEYN